MNVIFDVRTCRECGCTDDDCTECVAATGEPCSWVESDLCSRCAAVIERRAEVVTVSCILLTLGAALFVFAMLLGQ